MTLSKNLETGVSTLTLSKEETDCFDRGFAVIKRSADSRGNFQIELQLKRPRTKEARFRGL